MSSISESLLSWLGVTRISNEGTTRCKIMMRSGPLIHQDHEPSIRVDEDHKFAVPITTACGHRVWSPEEMKSLQASSSEGRLFLEGIDRCMSVEACNWNREGELDCHREDEESQLLEMPRNLRITPSDTRHVGRTTREAEESWWWSDRALERWRIMTQSMHTEAWWTLHAQGAQKL